MLHWAEMFIYDRIGEADEADDAYELPIDFVCDDVGDELDMVELAHHIDIVSCEIG